MKLRIAIRRLKLVTILKGLVSIGIFLYFMNFLMADDGYFMLLKYKKEVKKDIFKIKQQKKEIKLSRLKLEYARKNKTTEENVRVKYGIAKKNEIIYHFFYKEDLQ